MMAARTYRPVKMKKVAIAMTRKGLLTNTALMFLVSLTFSGFSSMRSLTPTKVVHMAIVATSPTTRAMPACPRAPPPKTWLVSRGLRTDARRVPARANAMRQLVRPVRSTGSGVIETVSAAYGMLTSVMAEQKSIKVISA